MSSESNNQKKIYSKLKNDDIVPYDVALERLKHFSTRYTENTVYEEIQTKNRNRNRNDIPTVQQAGRALSQLSKNINKNIASIAKTLQTKY